MNTRITRATHVTWVGFYVNLLLVAFKLAAGIVGHSGAMVADAVHSLSDFATDVIVLVSFRVVGKPPDASHRYGHGKFETLATAGIGIALFLVGAGILWTGTEKIWANINGTPLERPGAISLIAAVVSIVAKEWLYQYTVHVGHAINSQAVVANAWHHRSDALSSIGTMLGIGGAIFLGKEWHVLDPLAAVIVSVFIIKVAATITTVSVRELGEESLDEEIERYIMTIASNVAGAVDPHNLRTRRIGDSIAIDLHIRVDGNMNVNEAHDIASRLEETLRRGFEQEMFVSIHVEPVRRDTV